MYLDSWDTRQSLADLHMTTSLELSVGRLHLELVPTYIGVVDYLPGLGESCQCRDSV